MAKEKKKQDTAQRLTGAEARAFLQDSPAPARLLSGSREAPQAPPSLFDERQRNILRALAPQSGARGVSDIALGVVGEALQGPTDPNERLKELLIQNELSFENPNLDFVSEVFTADPTQFQEILKQRSVAGPTGTTQSILDQQRASLINEAVTKGDTTKARQIEGLTDEQFERFIAREKPGLFDKLGTGFRDTSTTEMIARGLIPRVGQVSLIADLIQGHQATKGEEERFLQELLSE
jgi:hypothetical protein